MSNPIYKDLPPIERKRDGFLYRMTTAQHKQAKSLLRRVCCNYEDGNCLELDDRSTNTCIQCISCSVCCKWFRYEVLPLMGALKTEIFKDRDTKHCVICGQVSASKTGRKHIPTRLFKQAVNLLKEARQIEKVLDEIGTFNSGKKKAEALALLKKWFPQMEKFSGQLKKYQVTTDDLLAENSELEERAKASEKGKMNNTLERAKLESELNELQRVIDRIPPDVLAQLKQETKHHRRRGWKTVFRLRQEPYRNL